MQMSSLPEAMVFSHSSTTATTATANYKSNEPPKSTVSYSSKSIAAWTPSQLSVKKHVPVLVPPAEPTPHVFKPLSDIDDQELLRFQVPFIQYYKNNPKMNGKDPVAVIKDALAKALVFYYPFAGRLREGEGRKLIVECTGEGVLFVEAEANLRLEDFAEQLPPPLPWLKELLCDVPGSAGITDCPLLLFQVTRLACNGFTVAVRLNHTMADAQGISQFLTAISELARGLPSLSLHPIWARDLLSARDPPQITHTHHEFETILRCPCTPSPPSQPLVHKSFFFGPTEIAALKSRVPFKCTSFEVIVASMWRARVIALCLDPQEEIRFMFNINLRWKMDPPMPKGYYGNAFVYPAVLATVGDLCDNPLSYAVELVQEAKKKTDDGYIRSMVDLLAAKGRYPIVMDEAKRIYFVSDNTRAGYAEVDYGWGPAEYGGPAVGGLDDMLPGVLSFLVAFRNEKGEKGTVVPMCLPDDAMDRLIVEVEKLVSMSVVA